MRLIKNALDRILSNRVSPGLWAAAISVHILLFSLSIFFDDEPLSDPAPILVGGLVIFGIVLVVLYFVTLWKLTRSLGGASAAEHGDFASWFGWGIVAGLPSVLALGLFEYFDQISDRLWLGSVVFSFGLSLFTPILAHADGRAINAMGPSVSETAGYWFKNIGVIFVAYLAVSLPLGLAGSGIDAIKSSGMLTALGLSLASSAISFVSTILCIGVTVSAYREAEAIFQS